MSKRVEIVKTTGSYNKFTLAHDRVTVKIVPNEPNEEFLKKLAHRCADLEVPQTGRNSIDQTDIEHGYLVLYTQNRRKNRRMLGRIIFNEDPVKFELAFDAFDGLSDAEINENRARARKLLGI